MKVRNLLRGHADIRSGEHIEKRRALARSYSDGRDAKTQALLLLGE